MLFSALLLCIPSYSCKRNQTSLVIRNLLEDTGGIDLLTDTQCVDLGVKISRPHLLGRWSADTAARNGVSFTTSYEPSAIQFDALNLNDRTISIRCRAQSPDPVDIQPEL